MRMSRRKFEALVERALGTIPAEIRGRMDNVEIAEEIRKTVVHEIAHHFGIDDARLADLGYD